MLAKRLQNLNPYVPGEQPTDRVYIKINANENPYPPSPLVPQAVKEAMDNEAFRMGLYPDPDSTQLRQSIADMLNQSGGVFCRTNTAGNSCTPSEQDNIGFEVTPDMIFCGNGSDEVLSFVFYTCFDSDRPLVMPEHTYSFYPVYCGYYNIPMNRIPLKDDWTLDTEAMLEASNKTDSCTIFANPNAPTGIGLTRDEVRQMIIRSPKDRIFIVDEAYCDFGGESCIPLLSEFNNLIIVRTFSKSLSFAGQRLGYVVSNPEIIKSIFTVKNSFNHFPVDFITQTAAKAACSDVVYYAQTARMVVEQRESLTAFLKERGWTVIDSQTNFVFVRKEGLKGHDIYETVKKAGLLIRHFATPGIEDFVRITIGTKEQMDSLKEVLSNI